MVKHHYKEEGAQPGPDQPIDFEGNEIRLDLPMELTAVKDKWTIIPLTDPVVSLSACARTVKLFKINLR